MGQAHAPRSPRTRHVTAVLLLLTCALGAASARADERVDAASGVRSPLTSERRAAEQRLIDGGAPNLALVRPWTGDADVRLRCAAWRVLGAIGQDVDLRRAVLALGDPHPQAGQAAARAAVRLALALPPPDEPWLSSGSLTGRGRTALGLALGEEFEKAAPGHVPTCLYRMGEGVVPALRFLCAHPRFGVGIKARARTALSRVGGHEARRVLSAQGRATDADWWDALVEVGPGPELAQAHAAAAERMRLHAEQPSWRFAWRTWREQQALFRFLSHCPPEQDAADVGEYVSMRLASMTGYRGPPMPSLLIELLRAHLVLGEPSDESLEWVIEALEPRRRHPPRRGEEQAAVLMLLEPYARRPAVQAALEDLLLGGGLPHSVEAWALYLLDPTRRAKHAENATALIGAQGGAATRAQRRAGLHLWQRIGHPPPTLVRRLAMDVDPLARTLALTWVVEDGAQKRFPQAERDAALGRARDDPDDGVFLTAAEHGHGELEAAHRERLLALAVQGRRTVRGRAWRILARVVGDRSAGADDALEVPAADAGLDARLRAAAGFRRLLGR